MLKQTTSTQNFVLKFSLFDQLNYNIKFISQLFVFKSQYVLFNIKSNLSTFLKSQNALFNIKSMSELFMLKQPHFDQNFFHNFFMLNQLHYMIKFIFKLFYAKTQHIQLKLPLKLKLLTLD